MSTPDTPDTASSVEAVTDGAEVTRGGINRPALTSHPSLAEVARRARARLLGLVAAVREARTEPRGELEPMWCTGCGRDLGLAQPEFRARHPAPLCASCRAEVNAGIRKLPAVLGAPPEQGRDIANSEGGASS